MVNGEADDGIEDEWRFENEDCALSPTGPTFTRETAHDAHTEGTVLHVVVFFSVLFGRFLRQAATDPRRLASLLGKN